MSEPLLRAYQTSHGDHGPIAGRVEAIEGCYLKAPVNRRSSASSAHIAQILSADVLAERTSPALFSPDPQTASSPHDTNNDATQPSLQSERRHSIASSSSMPVVTSVGLPRKSAPKTPFAATMPMSCSITRNAPAWHGQYLEQASTPMTSPVPNTASKCLTSARMSRLAASQQQDQATSLTRKTSHLRNVSESSVRTVIRT